MDTVTNSFTIQAQDGQSVRGFYRDTGEGAIGLFLHGLLSDAEGDKSMSLWHQAEARNRSWIRFDMRAHGKSDGIFEQFSISRALEDAKLVMNLFPDRPKFLVGSSMGGWVAAQLATDPSLKVAGLVLIAPAFSFMEQLFGLLEPEQQQQWTDQGVWTFDGEGIDEGFTLSYDAVVDSKQYDLLNRAIDYQCPIRILHGKLDDVVPANQSIIFADGLPGNTDIEVNILPEADHRLSGHIEHILNKVDEIWPTSI